MHVGAMVFSAVLLGCATELQNFGQAASAAQSDRSFLNLTDVAFVEPNFNLDLQPEFGPPPTDGTVVVWFKMCKVRPGIWDIAV
jgi:hypothetical protein